MANRNSTIIKAYQGKNIKSVLKTGQFVNTYGANEKGPSPEISKLLGEPTIPASVKAIEFNIIKAYLIKKGASTRNANSMALLLIDSARLQQVTPMSLLESFDDSKVDFSETVQYLLNALNNTTNLVGTAVVKDNSQSYKANYIRP